MEEEATLKALKCRGRTPPKTLGQHYLVNSSINELLASVARVEDGDCILEIGPGTRALTQVLDAGATVLTVEKDPHMVIHVRDRFEGIDRLTVLEEDFTKCHICSHLSPMLETGESVGNDAKYARVRPSVGVFEIIHVDHRLRYCQSFLIPAFEFLHLACEMSLHTLLCCSLYQTFLPST